MSYFLAIQNNFHYVELALFQDTQCLTTITISKIEASAQLIVAIKEILNRYNLVFKNLSFIAANQGPGPFTTLRVVIATVNGISFATKMPLIGVDGLVTFLDEHKNEDHPITVALLNAFNQEAYFGIDGSEVRETGCRNAEQLLQELKKRYTDQKIRFIGSGVEVFKNQILATFGPDASFFPRPLPEQCSLQAVGVQALQQWQKQKNIQFQLLPLYLKNQVIRNS